MEISKVQGELTKLQFFIKEKIEILQKKLQLNDVRIGTLNKMGTRLQVLKLHFATLECLITSKENKLFPNQFETITRFDCFIGIFSFFEDAVLIILEKTLNKKTFEKMFASDLIYKIQNEKTLLEYIKQYQKEIYEMILRKSLIPNPSRKIDRLKGEGIIDEKERIFLQFCLILRNSMHSNGYYIGRNTTFEILGEKFELRNKEPIKDITLTRYINWLKEFIRIFYKICEKTENIYISDNTLIE